MITADITQLDSYEARLLMNKPVFFNTSVDMQSRTGFSFALSATTMNPLAMETSAKYELARVMEMQPQHTLFLTMCMNGSFGATRTSHSAWLMVRRGTASRASSWDDLMAPVDNSLVWAYHVGQSIIAIALDAVGRWFTPRHTSLEIGG